MVIPMTMMVVVAMMIKLIGGNDNENESFVYGHGMVDDVFLMFSRRWRYLQLCFNFLRTLIRYDQPMPPRTVALFTNYLIHDALAIRKVCNISH